MDYVKTLVGGAVAVMLFAAGAVAAPPPPGAAVKILSPKFFPGWQAQNVWSPSVFFDTAAGHYKMYYSGSASEQWNDCNWDQWVTGLVTSTDSQTWKYPDNYEQVLFARKLYEGDVVDPDDSAAVFDSIFAFGACAIKEGSTYKAWYTGWNGEFEHLGGGLSNKINFRIGYATSTDGTAWTKFAGTAGGGAVLGLGSPGAQDAKGAAQPYVLKIGSTYYLWYEGYDGTIWRIFRATSSDGQSWTKQGLALNTGASGALDEKSVQNPMVLSRGGLYELWYTGRSNAAPNYHVLRATSPDALAWTKLPLEVTLNPDTPITGSERVLVDSGIVQGDNTIQIFFAKETTVTRVATYATLSRKHFHLYTETVNP